MSRFLTLTLAVAVAPVSGVADGQDGAAAVTNGPAGSIAGSDKIKPWAPLLQEMTRWTGSARPQRANAVDHGFQSLMTEERGELVEQPGTYAEVGANRMGRPSYSMGKHETPKH